MQPYFKWQITLDYQSNFVFVFLKVSFWLVTRSQTFRLMAEGLGTLATLNGQESPRGHWQVKQPIMFRCVMFRGVEMPQQ